MIRRYESGWLGSSYMRVKSMNENDAGEWCKYSDIAPLEADRDKYKKILMFLRDEIRATDRYSKEWINGHGDMLNLIDRTLKEPSK